MSFAVGWTAPSGAPFCRGDTDRFAHAGILATANEGMDELDSRNPGVRNVITSSNCLTLVKFLEFFSFCFRVQLVHVQIPDVATSCEGFVASVQFRNAWLSVPAAVGLRTRFVRRLAWMR